MTEPVERKYELYTQEAKANAYELFAKMRQENPVHCQPGIDGQTMIWFVTSYDEVEQVLRDDKHFVREARNALPPEQVFQQDPLQAMMSNHMLNKDWDDHRRLRTLVSQAFTPRRIQTLRPRIQTIAHELLDGVASQGKMDLIADYSFHLPTIVIAEMLGIPVEDREKFKVWSNAALTPTLDDESVAEFIKLMQEFMAYLTNLFAERRKTPGDDLLSALLEAEADGDSLNESELFAMLFLLIIAGHETTVSLIANAMVALWQHPDQLALLKKEPERMKTAVEEFLRYDNSVERAFNRWVAEDVTLGDQFLPKGSLIIPILAAANHDPEKFAQPERLDINRESNNHLSFGKGAHYCLGAPLARLETEIALNTLLERLPNIQMSIPFSELRWRLSPGFRTLEALPVQWE
ncbi:MAG: cytochrome P450 [Ardenticatenaceae bacterium]|nr:cytochrome P450 [Ardenticatenaceae bacterium]